MSEQKLSYICFKSSDALEEWQTDHPEHGIVSVTPLVGGIDLSMVNDTMTGITAVSVFVVYARDVK